MKKSAIWKRLREKINKGTLVDKEDAVTLIDKLAQEHDIGYYIFKDREEKDCFIRDI